MVEEGLSFLECGVLPAPLPDLRKAAHPSLPPPRTPLQPLFPTTGRKQVAKARWPHNVS